MGKAVEDGAGEALLSEDLCPFVEGQVRRDEDRAAFVALGDDLEEQFGADLAEGNKAQFVDDQEFVAGKTFLQPLQTAVVGCFHEFVHQARRTILDPNAAEDARRSSTGAEIERTLQSMYRNICALADRMGSGVYTGPTLVIRGEDNTQTISDRALGWQPFCQNLDCVDMPYKHAEFFTGDAATAVTDVVARWFQQRLESSASTR